VETTVAPCANGLASNVKEINTKVSDLQGLTTGQSPKPSGIDPETLEPIQTTRCTLQVRAATCHGESWYTAPVLSTIPVSAIPVEEYLKIFLCDLEIATFSLPTTLH
jgi:hypothetical protein